MSDDSPTIPHCDSSVLHAPGECRYCDEVPEWQQYRTLARINFTGHDEEGYAPCPSTYFRPLEKINRWPGNTPQGWLNPDGTTSPIETATASAEWHGDPTAPPADRQWVSTEMMKYPEPKPRARWFSRLLP